MITACVLTSSLIFATFIQPSNAHIGQDMTDEDFAEFVEAHEDYLHSITEFVANHHSAFESGAFGGAGGAVGVGMKIFAKHPIAGPILTCGVVDLVKELFKQTVNGKNAKSEDLDELSKQLETVIKELNALKAQVEDQKNNPTVGDFTSGHGHESRSENTGKDDPRSSAYRIGGSSYTRNGKDAGPHRDGYREYRDNSGGDLRDTIDRSYNDAMSDRDYVSKR